MTEINYIKLQLELAQEEEIRLRKLFVESEENYSWDDIKILFAMYETRIEILKSKLNECVKDGKCSDKRIPYNGC